MDALRGLAVGLALIWGALPVAAHEFWISATDYRPEADEAVKADLLVGSDMAGQAYPWLRRNVVAARLIAGGVSTDLTGREGDLPALAFAVPEAGLAQVIFHAQPSFVVFDKPETFPHYLDYEGLDWVLAAHKARGLPEVDFVERYTRNARALVQVGPASADQKDAPSGMPFELVAMDNPYVAGLTAMGVRLTWQGVPQPDEQVAVFVKAPDGVVTRRLLRTDTDGVALVPLGLRGEYMLSSVHMEPLEGNVAAVWDSHWATLTFALGE